MTVDHDKITTLEERTKQTDDNLKIIRNLLVGVFLSMFGLIGVVVVYGGKIVARQVYIQEAAQKKQSQDDADYNEKLNRDEHCSMNYKLDMVIRKQDSISYEQKIRWAKWEKRFNSIRGIKFKEDSFIHCQIYKK